MNKSNFALFPRETTASVNIRDNGLLFGFADEEHVIVERKNGWDDPSEVMIINARDQEVSQPLVFDKRVDIAFSSKVVVALPKWRDGQIAMYSIKSNPRLEIRKLDSQAGKIEWNRSVQCQFLQANQFLIHDFIKQEKCFRVFKQEFNEAENRVHLVKQMSIVQPDLQFRSYQDGREDIEVDTVSYCITHANNHLVYLSFKSEGQAKSYSYVLNTVSLQAEKCIRKTDLSLRLEYEYCEPQIVSLPNDDDFIIFTKDNSHVTYCKLNSKCELTKKDIGGLDDRVESVGILNDRLFYIHTNKNCHVYETQTLAKIHAFEPGNVCMNSRYLFHSNGDKVKVFGLSNLSKELSVMQTGKKHVDKLNPNSKDTLILNDKYVIMQLKNGDLTFLSFDH